MLAYVMMIGLFVHQYVVIAGAILFSAVLLFQLVTLPVEFDATARAKKLIVEAGIIDSDERYGVDRTLNAAALTYVAAVVTTLLLLAASGMAMATLVALVPARYLEMLPKS